MRQSWSLALGLAGACAQEPPTSSVADDRPLLLPAFSDCNPGAGVPASLRVATWNVSATRRSSIDAVLDEVVSLDADVLVVQEIEIGARRTGEIDQPAALADALGYAYAFAAALEFDGGDFGMAVFSRLPFSAAARIPLESDGAYEPRIALDATVCAGALPLRVVDVHADFMEEANAQNLAELAGVLGPVGGTTTLIAGDFNAGPDAPSLQNFIATTGTVDIFAQRDPGNTRGQERIDFLLTNPTLDTQVLDAMRVSTTASDHTPLVADFGL